MNAKHTAPLIAAAAPVALAAPPVLIIPPTRFRFPARTFLLKSTLGKFPLVKLGLAYDKVVGSGLVV